MALIVATARPNNLLQRIKEAIDDEVVVTWEYDHAGDFKHSVEQWHNSGWLRPTIGEEELRLDFVPVQGVPTTPAVYGVLHGRFVEMLLTHFSDHFTHAYAVPA